MRDPRVAIISPRDGDILNRHDGAEADGRLTVEVEGIAPPGLEVTVNGRPAVRAGLEFAAQVDVTDFETTIQARTEAGADEITVLYDRDSYRRFRFSVDDNILFLRDLTEQRPESLFDHWFLAFWREMHERYGAKIHINIYHQTEGFTLTEMPARWRDEWRDNANWLHLSCHGLANEPDWIYRHAPAARVVRDFEWVMNEIERFAGSEVMGNTTTVHWAEATREACIALHRRGITQLVSIPQIWDGEHITSYYLDRGTVMHMMGRDAWRDTTTGQIFICCDQVVNKYSPKEVVGLLDEAERNPHRSEMIELLIHEQYFREEHRVYQPDIRDKVIAALDWVTERGYEPCFWCEGFLGNTRGWPIRP